MFLHPRHSPHTDESNQDKKRSSNDRTYKFNQTHVAGCLQFGTGRRSSPVIPNCTDTKETVTPAVKWGKNRAENCFSPQSPKFKLRLTESRSSFFLTLTADQVRQ